MTSDLEWELGLINHMFKPTRYIQKVEKYFTAFVTRKLTFLVWNK